MNEQEFVEANTPEKIGEVDSQVEENQLGGQEPEAPQLNEVEQKAYDQGWRPQEDFEGPEDNWKTAKEYVKDGEWLNKIKDLNQKVDSQRREFDERLENTNKLNDARRKQEIEDLRTQQREAVDLSDTDAYDKTQKQIDRLEKESVPAVETNGVAKDPAITAWENENPWINETGNEKAGIALSVWNNYVNQNPSATVQQALNHVDDRINKLYPKNNSNPRRQQPNTNESPTRTPSRKNKDLTMNDLTPDERNDWNKFGNTIFKTEKAFLKAVTDSRKK